MGLVCQIILTNGNKPRQLLLVALFLLHINITNFSITLVLSFFFYSLSYFHIVPSFLFSFP
ncbi:hypothetical protein Lalb_Chr24g0394801 [Lupinus albus]|uniref:Uncharacterized protein n=1 Tax=Lupinus albus TaxID=3870 RepID=A0A6A4NEQ6_LUPAL|nr:hypothetical protein Lalb_Chr24g0394801 [Lupinus albus]